jgi:hypothetical protein
MKNSFYLHLFIFFLPFICFSQNIKNIDFIAPYNDSLAAVKQDNKWGFIDAQGNLVINFRDDLVVSNYKEGSYPVFSNNRCVFTEEKEGIKYFGYINKAGETAIKPRFLNASAFNNERATALEIVSDTIGFNNILKKPVVKYKYFEVLIDANGNILAYLTQTPKGIVLSADFVKEPPKITSKLINSNLVAVRNENKTWDINKIVYIE